MMFFRRHREKAARMLIVKALEEHALFQREHVARSTAALEKTPCAATPYRTVPLEDGNKLVRDLGAYDRDQVVDRVVGEVTRIYFLEGKNPPPGLRDMVEGAVR